MLSPSLHVGPLTNNDWQEENKFEQVEKEYLAVAELAREEEVELRWVTYFILVIRQTLHRTMHGNLCIKLFSSLSPPPEKMQKVVEGTIFAEEVISLRNPPM
jgi:hypothetical protein